MPKQLPPIGADVTDLVSGGGLPPIGSEIADPVNAPTPHEVPPVSAFSRFLSAFGEGINPLNMAAGLYQQVRHPIDSANARLQAQAEHPFMAAVQNSPLGQFGGAPAGQRIAEGDVAGGLGEGATGAVGRGMEKIGASAPAKHLASWGGVEAAMRMDPYGAMVAAAPTAMKYGGKGLQAVGRGLERAPSSMDSLMGRVTGSGQTAALEDAAAARQAAFRQGMTPPEPMTPWSSGFGEDAAPATRAPRYRDQTGRSIPTSAELDAMHPNAHPLSPDYDPSVAYRRSMDEERYGIRPEYQRPPSMAALEAGDAGLGTLAADLGPATADDLALSNFNAQFKQQLMDSLLARAR